jgi:hypothetical protein
MRKLYLAVILISCLVMLSVAAGVPARNPRV